MTESIHAGAGEEVSNRRAITAGALAAPLLVGLWAVQAAIRSGYDPTRHPISLLALGDWGFVQIAGFVITGLLVVTLAGGYARLFSEGVGRTWLPRLVGATGVGLIISGIFLADAGAGFPAGAPAGAPELSWHGIVHEVGFTLVMLSWVATLIILFRRYRRTGERGLMAATTVVFLVVLLLSSIPHVDSYPVRAVLAGGVQLAFLAEMARRQLRRSAA